jgi:hypothetical protein
VNHPLTFIPKNARKPIFIGLLVWTLFLMAISLGINAPLTSSTAPFNIVSFELARTPSAVQGMIASWDFRMQLFAAFGLGFDYLFMPSYAFTIALASLLAAGRHKGWFAEIGTWLGWGVFLAALFDATENIGLWNSLLGNYNSVWPQVSFLCASFKFAFIFLGIAYGLIGWILPKKKHEIQFTFEEFVNESSLPSYN